MNSTRFSSVLAICLAPLALYSQQPPDAKTPKGPGFLLRQNLPAMDGNQLKLAVLELEYKPGGKTETHYHNGPVFVYVLEGAIVSQVEGQPEAVYRPGQSFYEAPKGVHAVSKNASGTERARALVIFLNDNDAPLTVPLQKTEKE